LRRLFSTEVFVADKLTKQDLRAPDAFQKTGGEARDWLRSHQDKVVLAVVAVLVLGGGAGLVSYFRDRQSHVAAVDLGAAMKQLQRSVSGETAEAKAMDAGFASFRSESDKTAAVTQSMDDFLGKHKSLPAAATATLVLANSQLSLGHFDEALRSFDDYLKDASSSDIQRAAALEGKGYAYEGKKDYAQAMAAFEQLSKENRSDFLMGMGMYHRARMLLLEGKKQEAAQGFSEVQTKFGASAAGRLSSDRLAVLAEEGIKPVTTGTPGPAGTGMPGAAGAKMPGTLGSGMSGTPGSQMPGSMGNEMPGGAPPPQAPANTGR
jgi:tetratricopeptide (TPR) repeat protein